MGYQALLFCPDEKLARIVAQVFSDLEFNVEAVQEPFSAVKKLMSQRYDALVVDCENESNASLLFKSARNSTSNQGTLAIAVVEGQAGVAKAYRIGANLVLTKPINVEQAKGTLRVARGLLRKNSEAHAAPAATAPITPASISGSPEASTQTAASEPTSVPAVPARPTAPVSPKVTRELPEFEPATPTIAASVSKAPVSFLEEVSNQQAAPAETPEPIMSALPAEKAKPVAVNPPAVSPSASVAGHGAAAAPAKVKEVILPSTETVELQPDPVLEGADSEPVGSTPSFSALDLDHSPASGGNKKILIAAAIVIAVAAIGYFGWSKIGSHQAASPAVESVSTPQRPSTSTPVPTSAPASATATPTQESEHVGPINEPVSSKSAPSIGPQKSANQVTTRPQAPPEPEVKTTNLIPPIKVKSGPQVKKSGDESSAAAPNPLAIADANTSALNSLVASTPSTSRPTLATLNISQGVSQGLLIKRVDPKYPPSALAMHLQGAVLLDATINREGMISNVTVVKGDKLLARAAVDAVRQWRYKPYYLDGSPVEIQTQITINFKLPN